MTDQNLRATVADPRGIREQLARGLEGRYRIERALGAGGMATVWLAEDLKHKRRVAIKVLRPEIATSVGNERFLKEIEIAAGLRHPRVLPLYDSGQVEDLLYYVMPYIEGESLRARMERHPALTLDECVRVIGEVAEALTYAHGRDVVHRDIKPENILLDGGHALVADFGLARALMSADDARLTSTGMSLGTPLYMSPEQASGDLNVDARGDLYSLACVLFEMLAGRPPFTGGTPEAILIQRFTQPPPRLTSARADAPPALDSAIFRAMARDPNDRFDSVARFVEALQSQSARAAGTSSSSIAVLPFANMSGSPSDDYFSDGISEEIINALARVEGLRVAARTSTFAFKGRHEDLRLVGEKLNVATVLEGGVRKSGNRLRITAQLINVADGYHLWSERYDRELTDVFEIQDEIAGAIATKLRGSLAPEATQRRGTLNLEAYDLFLKARALQWRRGRWVLDSGALLEQAVALDPSFADAQALLSDAYRLMGLYGMRRPDDAMPKAKAAAERALELDPGQAEAYTTLGDYALTYERNYDEALRLWTHALELKPNDVRALCEHALWGKCALLGQTTEAMAQARKALETDPLSAWAAGMNALILLVAGRPEDALAESNRAVGLDPGSFMARWQLISALLAVGDGPAAVASATEALETWRHPWFLGRLGMAYALAGNREGAEAVYAELTARARIDYVQPFWLSVAAAAIGREDEAMDIALRGVVERDPLAIWVLLLPECEPLRRHARYGELIAALGAEKYRWR